MTTGNNNSDEEESTESSDNTLGSEVHQPKFTIGGTSTNFSHTDNSLDEEGPTRQTTIIGLGDSQDNNQVQVVGLQYQQEKQGQKTYTSESQLEKELLKHQRRISRLKIASIIVITLIILGAAGWVLFSYMQ